jgi:hypothetical protein
MEKHVIRTVAIPCTSPMGLDLGAVYVGDMVEGSFQVFPASQGSITKAVSTLNGRDHQDTIVFRGPLRARGSGLAWDFSVRAVEPGRHITTLDIETDSGTAYQWVRMDVCPRPPHQRSVFFCSSPFNALSSQRVQRPLKLLLRGLGLGLSASDSLPDDLGQFQTVVLHWCGLDYLLREERMLCHEYLRRGGRLVLFADDCFEGSVMKVNHLTETYGVLMRESEYDEVVCEKCDVILNGPAGAVERLYWHRPSPISAVAEAEVLVSHPTRRDDGLLVRSGPHGNLFVVGSSLLESFLCVGWPFDNDRLFANLVGGFVP